MKHLRAESTFHRISLRRKVAALSIPVLLSSLLQRLVAIVDIFLVGGLGAAAIAATGLGQLLVFVVMTLFWGLSTGTSVVIAHLHGSGKSPEKRKSATSSLLAGLCLVISVSWAGSAFAPELALLLGAVDEVLLLAAGYIRLVFLYFAFTAGLNILSAIMHGSGDTRTPMQAIIVVNIVHILLAYPLIYGLWGAPRLGVTGAAIAINVSEGIGFLYLFSKAISDGHLAARADFQLFRRIWNVGYPVALERIAQQSGQLVYAKMILAYGTTAYAAHQVGVSIESLSFMPGAGMGIAAAALMGHSLGARKFMRARAGHREALRLSVLVMGSMAILFFVIPEHLLKLFTHDPEVILHGTVFLRLVALAQIPLALAFVYAGSLRGTGDTHMVFLITLGTMWGVRVLLAWIAKDLLHLSLYVVWFAFVVDWYLRAALFAWRFHKRNLRASTY